MSYYLKLSISSFIISLMISLLAVGIASSLLYMLLITFCMYISYSRFLMPLYKWWYYKRQGIQFITPPVPFFGDYLSMYPSFLKNPKKYPFYVYIRNSISGSFPEVIGFYASHKPSFIICSPDLL